MTPNSYIENRNINKASLAILGNFTYSQHSSDETINFDLKNVAREEGIEPSITVPETVVLPVTPLPNEENILATSLLDLDLGILCPFQDQIRILSACKRSCYENAQ